MSTEDNLTEAGWPRPVHGGWPVPWVSPSDDLSTLAATRVKTILERKLCQVCGLGHEPGSQVVVCVKEANFNEVDPQSTEVRCMDEALMHERCAKLSLAKCPRLRHFRDYGALVVLSVNVDELKAVSEGGESYFRVHARHTKLLSRYSSPSVGKALEVADELPS